MRPLTAFLFVSCPVLAQAPEVTVEPRAASWQAACAEGLDPDRAMPWAAGGPDEALVVAMRRLADAEFEPAEDAEDETYARSFGDLVKACAALRDRPRALAMLLDRLERTRPDVWEVVGPWLPGLATDHRLRSGEWDPSEERYDDGFVFGPPIRIGSEVMPEWRKVEGSQLVQQAAALVFADLVAFETVENDYRTYYEHVGSAYETLLPVPGSAMRGECPDGRPFATLRLRFTSDLPFPFSSYDCDLDILERVDDDGLVQSWTETRSRDFYWLAGNAIYLPVLDSEGEFVALLAVRQFGFDLRGVPDADADRRASLRGLLGNLKLRAEALWADERDEREPVWGGTIPDVPIIGRP